MKKKLLRTIALVSALTLSISLFATACSKDKEESKASAAVTHVAIDVNPSITITVDDENKVISVHASNEDAQIMLYGEDLTGLSLEVALEKIAQLSIEFGYLNEDNHGVNFSVNGTIGDNEISAMLDAAFDKHAGNLEVNLSAEGTFTDIRELEALKAKYEGNVKIQNLTIEDYKLIVDVQSIDGSISFEEAVNMKKQELMAIIAEGVVAIEPYATEAYNIAVGIAERAYNELKGQLLDAMWMVPYTTDLANILTGTQKYPVHNGALYNMYSASSRALGVAIDSIETAIKVANEMQVPTEVTDQIAIALNLNEEQKAEFIAEITVDGKITLVSLENYLNKWFKNMTEEKREEVKATVNEIMAEVQAFATQIDEAVAEEYKTAVVKLAKDLTSLIPEEFKFVLGSYLTEFENLVTKIAQAVDSKEPLAAIKSAKEVFDGETARLLSVMKAELTDEDLKGVEDAMALVNDTLSGYERAFAEAKAQAEATAKAWLEEQRAKRLA